MEREFITIQEFAKKLHISPSTAYNWIARGKLIIGQHVVHVDGVIRIVWCDALVDHLLEISIQEKEKAKHPPLKRRGRGDRSRLAFDLEAASEVASEVSFPGIKSHLGVKSKTGRNTPRETKERGIKHEQ